MHTLAITLAVHYIQDFNFLLLAINDTFCTWYGAKHRIFNLSGNGHGISQEPVLLAVTVKKAQNNKVYNSLIMLVLE